MYEVLEVFALKTVQILEMYSVFSSLAIKSFNFLLKLCKLLLPQADVYLNQSANLRKAELQLYGEADKVLIACLSHTFNPYASTNVFCDSELVRHHKNLSALIVDGTEEGHSTEGERTLLIIMNQ